MSYERENLSKKNAEKTPITEENTINLSIPTEEYLKSAKLMTDKEIEDVLKKGDYEALRRGLAGRLNKGVIIPAARVNGKLRVELDMLFFGAFSEGRHDAYENIEKLNEIFKGPMFEFVLRNKKYLMEIQDDYEKRVPIMFYDMDILVDKAVSTVNALEKGGYISRVYVMNYITELIREITNLVMTGKGMTHDKKIELEKRVIRLHMLLDSYKKFTSFPIDSRPPFTEAESIRELINETKEDYVKNKDKYANIKQWEFFLKKFENTYRGI